MAWTDFKFTPEDGLDNTTTFPSKPTSGAAARTQFMTILNQIKAFFNGTVKNTIDEHEAEYATDYKTVARDLSIVGEQKITGFNFKPELVMVTVIIENTKTLSMGMATETSMYCLGMYPTNGLWYRRGDRVVRITNDGATNMTDATVTFGVDNSIILTWSHIGTGATGAASVFITAFAHRREE